MLGRIGCRSGTQPQHRRSRLESKRVCGPAGVPDDNRAANGILIRAVTDRNPGAPRVERVKQCIVHLLSERLNGCFRPILSSVKFCVIDSCRFAGSMKSGARICSIRNINAIRDNVRAMPRGVHLVKDCLMIQLDIQHFSTYTQIRRDEVSEFVHCGLDYSTSEYQRDVELFGSETALVRAKPTPDATLLPG